MYGAIYDWLVADPGETNRPIHSGTDATELHFGKLPFIRQQQEPVVVALIPDGGGLDPEQDMMLGRETFSNPQLGIEWTNVNWYRTTLTFEARGKTDDEGKSENVLRAHRVLSNIRDRMTMLQKGLVLPTNVHAPKFDTWPGQLTPQLEAITKAILIDGIQFDEQSEAERQILQLTYEVWHRPIR